MRHKVAGKRLDRHQGARNALRRTLVKQLFEHERIKTTKAKAQAIRGQAEKLITLAKRGIATDDQDKLIHAKRLAASRLADKEIVFKLFEDIAPRYTERAGGYTRMLKLGPRYGDRADMVILELVEKELILSGKPDWKWHVTKLFSHMMAQHSTECSVNQPHALCRAKLRMPFEQLVGQASQYLLRVVQIQECTLLVR